ncbi:MAG: phosphatidate cytidylyltransferase [Candidatus Competibacteraceae bacterium]|nr:MAG: phosphatidate cytidylyltransferase [Candidatus Competibacteraceae bacterium]
MTAQEKFFWLIGGIAAILLVASIAGWLLGLRVKTENGRAVIGNLNARIQAWWIMTAVFVVAFLLGKTATIILFAFISFSALREFLTLTPTRASDYRAMSLAFFVLVPVQYYLIHIEWYGLFSMFIPVYGFLLLPSLSALTQDAENFLERSAKIQWGIMVTIYCISHVPALLLLDIPGYTGQNALLLLYMLLVVQMSDVLQYVFGKIFGKTKIAPVVSPSKTVEGFIGGAAGATLIGAGMWWITPFTPLQAGAMAFITVLMGFLGGLVLSAVKRSLGAKDWGTMIKGHGGMMDRMDSVSFAAPIFFHLTRYFFTS